MKKFLLLALIPFAALATDNVLTWTPPTQYEDGTPLPPAELTHYVVNVTWQGEPQAALEAPGGANATFTHAVTARGTWCYTLQAVSVDDEASVPSNEACKTVTHGKPRPVINLTIR